VSDTFFTTSPHWGIYVLLYFFVGGIAGGSLFLAGLLHLFGTPADRATVRTGQYVALVGAALSALLLTLDLTKPFRFWHMLIESNTGAPMFKAWSPMSVGAWTLLGFGALALLASLGALGESRGGRWGRFARLARGGPGGVLAVAGAVLGLFFAGYTGILLSVTNRPIWADSTWLGLLFLLSGVSAATATLFLLGRRIIQPRATRAWLVGFDRRILTLELLVLAVFLWSLGAVAESWVGWNGILLAGGVAGAGILAPLLLDRSERRAQRETRRAPAAAGLVLLGSFLLRLLVLVSSAGIQASGSGVTGR
jgi:formate-dependent nitrite reductase membrane component NrfD